MAYLYALRVDGDNVQTLSWLGDISASGFGVREAAGSENEHCHYMIRSDRKLQALRKAFLKAVSVRGNGGYSLTACRDADRYEKYMCKGDSEAEGPCVVYTHGFDGTPERIQALHDSYWEANAVAQRRKRSLPVTDSVLAEAKRRVVQWNDRAKLSELYIRELASRNKPINLYAVKSAVNAIQVALCPTDEAIDELVNRALA